MADRKRLIRLQRLEKVRAIAKQTAMAEAARAESTLAQLQALEQRTRDLAHSYARRDEATDAHALRQTGRFSQGLQGMVASTAQDTARARAMADVRMAELGLAERRRAAVADRAEAQARALDKARQAPVLGARRATGTGLE